MAERGELMHPAEPRQSFLQHVERSFSACSWTDRARLQLCPEQHDYSCTG
jgi:hypothetical protein